METKTKYEGFTNYNTWRIHYEYFTNAEYHKGKTADDLKHLVENSLQRDCENYTTWQLALVFLENVNWQEIEELINKEV